jgi:hypothetical protein
MSLGGDAVERYLRVVRTHLDALAQNLEDALAAVVPEHYRDAVRARWQEQHAQRILPARVLSGLGGPRAWFAGWNPSAGYYWVRQREYLLDKLGRSEIEVESLDDSTDKILSHLEDPRPTGPTTFRVQGLVMGYVQSGKTANFSALVAKAADAGYKLVIVLSGIHNALRQQTQRRLDRELGISAGGVGEPEAGKRWIPLTTSDLYGDFSPGTVGANVLQGNERVLLVVKKNATVLRRLVAWMFGRPPAGLPVLIIDDEADQASINTGGNRPILDEVADLTAGDVDRPGDPDEIDPSVINGLIRALIASFQRVSYVAYTATPFANVLVHHDALDRDVLNDLYPRDFIISLPRPAGYVGAERLFGRAALPGEPEGVAGLDVINMIPDPDVGELVPPGRDVTTFHPQLSASLRTAFLDFILAIAARLQRAGADRPAAMLIHTSHRTAIQNRMGDVVREHVTELRQRWRYDVNSIRPGLKERWDARFRPLIASLDASRDLPFEALEGHIDRLFKEPVTVLVLNSSSDDVLDYEANPTLKAVLIGGNRLSRGLTLEGLLVSYYVRETLYFDTLLQMGRWFGYREEYVDLTTLWMTAELAGYFEDLALAEEELRREIARYERENLTPLHFGPRIRSHPVMMITAENKMGSARRVSQNFSGRLVGTTMFRLDDRAWLQRNLEATRRFLGSLGRPDRATDGRFVWSRVAADPVDRFLAQYMTDPRASRIDVAPIRQYISAQVGQRELTSWWVAVISQREAARDTEDLSIAGHPVVNTISRTRKKTAPFSIGSLVNPATMKGRPGDGDEEIGLSEEQILRARSKAADARVTDPETDVELGDALRAERSKEEGLLLIYPISKYSRPAGDSKHRLALFENPERDGCTVVGVALAFPASDSAATIEWVVGSVGTLVDDGRDGR